MNTSNRKTYKAILITMLIIGAYAVIAIIRGGVNHAEIQDGNVSQQEINQQALNDTASKVNYSRVGALIDIFDSCTVKIVPDTIITGVTAKILFRYVPVDDFLEIDDELIQQIRERNPYYAYETEPIRTIFIINRESDLIPNVGYSFQEQLLDVQRNVPPKDVAIYGLGERLKYIREQCRAEFTTTFRDLWRGEYDYSINLRFARPGKYKITMAATFADQFRLIRPTMTDKVITVEEK